MLTEVKRTTLLELELIRLRKLMNKLIKTSIALIIKKNEFMIKKIAEFNRLAFKRINQTKSIQNLLKVETLNPVGHQSTNWTVFIALIFIMAELTSLGATSPR